MSRADLLNIFCDESGFTGNKLLDAEQEVFAYAAVEISPEEAKEFVQRLRCDFRLQAPELKGSTLVSRSQGKRIVSQVLKYCEGRYLVVAHLKPYALACKFFEYIFEPAVSSFNSLLYQIDFHRFIATVLYLYFRARNRSAESVLEDFIEFAHRGDANALQRIFPADLSADYKADFLVAAGTFALLHQDKIKKEVTSFREPGVPNWILDLTTTSLFSLLTSWGEKSAQLDVTCDDSKPIKGDIFVFDSMIDRKESSYVRFQNKERPFSFNLKSSLKMADSKNTPGLQIADVIASVTSTVWRSAYRGKLTDEYRAWQQLLLPHFHDDSIWPVLSYADLDNSKCFANTIVLQELIDRSIKHADLSEGLADIYLAALQLHPQFLAENRKKWSPNRS